jgi:hypothetical protein
MAGQLEHCLKGDAAFYTISPWSPCIQSEGGHCVEALATEAWSWADTSYSWLRYLPAT